MNLALNAVLVKAPSQSALRFSRSPNGETYLAEQLLRFPYHITRVHRRTAGAARADLCLQALGGGLVEGDDIRLAVDVGDDAQVRLTTQSSTKVHSMRGGEASQQVSLRVARGGWLEYLPRPLILFPDSHSRNTTRVTMPPDAGAVVVDAFYPFDPAGSGRLPRAFANTVEIVGTDGRLLVRDALFAAGPHFRRSRVLPGLVCQCAIFLLGSAAAVTGLSGYRHRSERANLACSRLPNDAGFCLRGFVSGTEVLAAVVEHVVDLMGKQRGLVAPANQQGAIRGRWSERG